MAGKIRQEDREWVEEWLNVGSSVYFIISLDVRGEEEQVRVNPERMFMITTEERLLTESKIADSKHNPFTNGAFRPIQVPPSVDIQTNPNALSDQDIDDILRSSSLAFEEWLKTVDSPVTVRRFLDRFEVLIEDEDLSARRLRQIEERFEVLMPRKSTRQKRADEYAAIK